MKQNFQTQSAGLFEHIMEKVLNHSEIPDLAHHQLDLALLITELS